MGDNEIAQVASCIDVIRKPPHRTSNTVEQIKIKPNKDLFIVRITYNDISFI